MLEELRDIAFEYWVITDTMPEKVKLVIPKIVAINLNKGDIINTSREDSEILCVDHKCYILNDEGFKVCQIWLNP